MLLKQLWLLNSSRAMVTPESKGQRHQIVSSSSATSLKEWALILDAEFGPKNYNVPTKTAPNFLTKFVSIFDKSVRLVSPASGHSNQLAQIQLNDLPRSRWCLSWE